MKAKEYKKIFGSVTSLSETIPWTDGLSSMVEYMLWNTKSVLGISKTKFWKMIIFQTNSPEFYALPLSEKEDFISSMLEKLISDNEAKEKYDKPKSGYCNPSEALRRSKYFSEDYLNKEFDIFINLCSDNYLNFLYSGFVELNHNGNWSTHGNNGIFWNSTGIVNMQMDNLAYNATENILIANELKLGAKKNKDQILKYCFMHTKLEELGFISKGSKFLLLFISDKKEQFDLEYEIDNEIAFCQQSSKDFKHLLTDCHITKARSILIKSITWHELIDINCTYLKKLDKNQQVEEKLLRGFNTSLKEKALCLEYPKIDVTAPLPPHMKESFKALGIEIKK